MEILQVPSSAVAEGLAEVDLGLREDLAEPTMH